jgi:hypothetical protein
MRLRNALWLFTLLPFAACAPLPTGIGPAQGAQLSCGHFYRNQAGVWQADGNATAVVNGRQWFLGIQQFTPEGPLIGGELLYNDIQRQCGGGLPIAPATPPPGRSAAAQCHPDGSPITLSGRISYRTVPPDNEDGLPGHHYARLTLDRPVCVLEGGFGAEPNGKVVAVMPEGVKASTLREGQHVTLSGRIMHKETANDPPESLQLEMAP